MLAKLTPVALAATCLLVPSIDAQQRAQAGLRRVTQPLGEAHLDLATGRYVRGPRLPAGKSATYDTEVTFSNLDLSGFVGIDSTTAEWIDRGIKGNGRTGGASEIMTAFTFAYCSSAQDVKSGGVGGSAIISFFEGYEGPAGGVGSGPSGTRVASYNLSGLPANTEESSFFGGFQCHMVTVNTATPNPSPGLSFAGGQALADGVIGWSWNFRDESPFVPLAHTFPFLACVSSCTGAQPDGLGMTDGVDRYYPAGMLHSTFTFGTATTFTSLNIEIEEAEAIQAESQSYNPGGNPDLLTSVATPRLGKTWGLALDCTGASSSSDAWLLIDASPPSSTIASDVGAVYFDGPVKIVRYPHAGGVAQFQLPIPVELAYYNVTFRVQGFCKNGTFRGSWLSNALDQRVGSF